MKDPKLTPEEEHAAAFKRRYQARNIVAESHHRFLESMPQSPRPPGRPRKPTSVPLAEADRLVREAQALLEQTRANAAYLGEDAEAKVVAAAELVDAAERNRRECQLDAEMLGHIEILRDAALAEATWQKICEAKSLPHKDLTAKKIAELLKNHANYPAASPPRICNRLSAAKRWAEARGQWLNYKAYVGRLKETLTI